MTKEIVPNLWFDGKAKEAAEYYISVFPNSKILSIEYYPNSTEDGLAEFQLELAGQPLVVEFELNNQHFTAINAGPEFKFSEAISFAVFCKDQEEIDYYWSKLSTVPEAEQCGWCKDKYGLSWQIVPENINQLMKKPDAYSKMMGMRKLIIAEF
ncbi:VOC family protein [Candidatus Saccharibacteria bacterium]|nr:VOC family protein [Candidatus Saccharibacteria bacterium]